MLRQGIPIAVSRLKFDRRVDGAFAPILSEISFTIPKGALLTVVGPSGCGKTTLLNIVCGILDTNTEDVRMDGVVRIGDLSPQEALRARLFGYCFQKPAMLEWRDVASNIELPLQLARIDRQERRRRVDEILRFVKLSDRAHSGVSELSGGMQQRIALARSLVLSPPVVLMDEPFAAIDEPLREILNLELLRLWQQIGSTIVFVTHNVSDAILLGTHVLVLSPQPARVVEFLEINLPERTPCVLTSDIFTDYMKRIRTALGRNIPLEEGGK